MSTTPENLVNIGLVVSEISFLQVIVKKEERLECWPMPNVMAALPNIGGALCSTPQSLADAHDQSAAQ